MPRIPLTLSLRQRHALVPLPRRTTARSKVALALQHAHRIYLACLAVGTLLWQSAAAEAQVNPVDQANHKLADRVLKAGRDPRALLPLLELWDNWDSSTPDKLQAELQRVRDQSGLAPP